MNSKHRKIECIHWLVTKHMRDFLFTKHIKMASILFALVHKLRNSFFFFSYFFNKLLINTAFFFSLFISFCVFILIYWLHLKWLNKAILTKHFISPIKIAPLQRPFQTMFCISLKWEEKKLFKIVWLFKFVSTRCNKKKEIP